MLSWVNDGIASWEQGKGRRSFSLWLRLISDDTELSSRHLGAQERVLGVLGILFETH